MFDISWGEMLLIGAAALIFIGPKELPAALRALGQMTGKVRRMAGEFRSQFDDAMREADVQSIRKEFDSMNEAASSTSSFNPLETIRNEIKGAVEKPADDKDRPSDLAPASDPVASSDPLAISPEPAPVSPPAGTALAEPSLPPPDAPAPVDVASFDVAPASPAPVTAAAPQPAPAAADVSPPKPTPAKEQA